MLAIPLQSGSNGNCIYVEANGVRLLFDAGISGKRAAERLAAAGRDIRDVDAVIISHDHCDHVRWAGVFSRKFSLPVCVTSATLQAAAEKYDLGQINDIRHFTVGEAMAFGPVRVETIATPHDGVDGAAFVVDDGMRRLGILTDLGFVFGGLDEVVASLDAAVIESNYDGGMLDGGTYPAFLKQRIRGPGGHISNVESAQLLLRAASRRMEWACLAHLSEQNNNPQLAMRTHRDIVGDGMGLYVAHRHQATQLPEL